MANRKARLIGSLPFDDEQEAMQIACSCGMGRRPREEAERLLKVTAAVAAV